MSNWIDVNDQSPEEDKEVLIYYPGGLIRIGYYDEEGWTDSHDYRSDFDANLISHWMPLPEPPTQPF